MLVIRKLNLADAQGGIVRQSYQVFAELLEVLCTKQPFDLLQPLSFAFDVCSKLVVAATPLWQKSLGWPFEATAVEVFDVLWFLAVKAVVPQVFVE